MVLLPAACSFPNPVLSKEIQDTSTNAGVTKGSPMREAKWKQAPENCGVWLNKAERDHYRQDARFLEDLKRKKIKVLNLSPDFRVLSWLEPESLIP